MLLISCHCSLKKINPCHKAVWFRMCQCHDTSLRDLFCANYPSTARLHFWEYPFWSREGLCDPFMQFKSLYERIYLCSLFKKIKSFSTPNIFQSIAWGVLSFSFNFPYVTLNETVFCLSIIEIAFWVVAGLLGSFFKRCM